MLEKQQCFHLQLESIRFYRRDVLFVSVLLLLFFFHFILFLAFEMIFNRIFKFWDSLTQRVIRGRGDRMNQSGERCFPLPSTAVRAFLGFFRDSLMTVCECVCVWTWLPLATWLLPARQCYRHCDETVSYQSCVWDFGTWDCLQDSFMINFNLNAPLMLVALSPLPAKAAPHSAHNRIQNQW